MSFSITLGLRRMYLFSPTQLEEKFGRADIDNPFYLLLATWALHRRIAISWYLLVLLAALFHPSLGPMEELGW